MNGSPSWPSATAQLPTGRNEDVFPRYLKLDVGDFVPEVRRDLLFRTSWGVNPGLVVAVDDPVAKVDLRGRAFVTAEELALDHRNIAVVEVEQPRRVAVADTDGRAEYTNTYMALLSDCGSALAQAVQVTFEQIISGGSVVGCSLGRDRTGILIALMLRGLGLDVTEIQRSEASMRERLATLVDISPHPFEGLSRRQLSGRLRAAHESIGDMLRYCEDAHGSVQDYLGSNGLNRAIWPALGARLLR